ncbi:MAG TPA: sigma-70 family RNA polymerase sigma factor [Phycisphaerae bacterium]|nr:sigma-70 family RNA polymerase sigma factor [Phycisphaerae bacterium]
MSRDPDRWYWTLYHEHEERLLTLLRAAASRWRLTPEEIDELAQQIRVRAWERRDTFDESRRFQPWLVGIAKNVVREHVRAAGVHRKTELRITPDEFDAICDAHLQIVPDHPNGLAEALTALHGCLAHLDANDRRLISLKYEQNKDSPQIGAALAMQAAAVRQRLRRALLQLRACIAGKLEMEPSHG